MFVLVSMRRHYIVYFNFQVSQVYQTMKIETLSGMIPFSEFAVVEKIAVDAVKNNFISIRIDHMKAAVFFGSQVMFHFGFEQHPPSSYPDTRKPVLPMCF